MKKLMVPVLGLTMLSFSALSMAATVVKTERDKLSYAMGAVTGKALKDGKIDINAPVFYAGMVDAQSSKKLQMTDDEIKQALQTFQKKEIEKTMADQKKGK